jgi:hypothetical protein
LVHKDKYFYKFGYNPDAFLANIVHCLGSLKEFCVLRGIKRLALPRIASNTERVHWRWTQKKLLEIFADVEITLVIYLQKQPKRFFNKTNSTPEEAHVQPTQRTDALLAGAAKRLAEEVDKGNVGGGSLPKLPSPNRKPPRQPLPDKVNAVAGRGKSNSNSSLGPRNAANTTKADAPAKKSAANKGAIPKKDVFRKDVLPRHLSGGGGNTTPSPPSSVPPLTNLPNQVTVGGSSGYNVPNTLSAPSMAPGSDLAEIILMLRDDMAKIRSEFSDLRRSVTPKRPERVYDIPVSPGSSAFVNSRLRVSSFDGKNTQRPVSLLAQ